MTRQFSVRQPPQFLIAVPQLHALPWQINACQGVACLHIGQPLGQCCGPALGLFAAEGALALYLLHRALGNRLATECAVIGQLERQRVCCKCLRFKPWPDPQPGVIDTQAQKTHLPLSS